MIKAPVKAHPVAPSATDDSDRLSTRPAQSRQSHSTEAMLCARVPTETRQRVKVYAARTDTSVQDVVREAIDAYLGQVDA
jgi:hypothetical protein